jgi:hypothetical protein
MKEDIQKLINICFEVGLQINSNKAWFKDKTTEETAIWIAGQLKKCGFPTKPVGASWGILDDKDEK